MIRDPSDGSVREMVQGTTEPAMAPIGQPTAKNVSGLPTASTKPSRQERLEKSREWLKTYFERNRA